MLMIRLKIDVVEVTLFSSFRLIIFATQGPFALSSAPPRSASVMSTQSVPQTLKTFVPLISTWLAYRDFIVARRPG